MSDHSRFRRGEESENVDREENRRIQIEIDEEEGSARSIVRLPRPSQREGMRRLSLFGRARLVTDITLRK